MGGFPSPYLSRQGRGMKYSSLKRTKGVEKMLKEDLSSDFVDSSYKLDIE
jgi:hypothetical protein